MKTSTALSLAVKSLLLGSALSIFVLPSIARAQCSLPSIYLNSATAIVGDLTFTVATDRAVYTSGDAVQVYMSIFNNGSASVVIPNPSSISPMNSWVLYSNNCPSWENEDCIIQTPMVFPMVVYYFGPPLTVNAGECKVFSASWNGRNMFTNDPATPGQYTLKGGMTGDPGYSFFMPQGGISLPVRIDSVDVVPAIATTWSTIKTRE